MMKKNRNRAVQLHFMVDEQEREHIRRKMEQFGTKNMGAYLRKMAVDGYVIRLDLPELRELLTLLRRCSSSLNQIAKRVNETGRVYEADLEDISQKQEAIWAGVNEILTRLGELS